MPHTQHSLFHFRDENACDCQHKSSPARAAREPLQKRGHLHIKNVWVCSMESRRASPLSQWKTTFVCQAAGHVPALSQVWLWPPTPRYHPTGFSLLLLPQPCSLNPARLWLQFRAGMGFGFVLQSSRCTAQVRLQHQGEEVMRVPQMSVSQTGCEI